MQGKMYKRILTRIRKKNGRTGERNSKGERQKEEDEDKEDIEE